MIRQLTSASSAQRGFTLVELLVAMVIVVIVAAGVTLSSGNSFNQEIRQQARRLATVLRMAQEDALINSVEVGLILDETEYTFVVFENDQWMPIVDDKIYETSQLPEGVEMALKVDGFSDIVLGQKEDADKEEEDDEESLTPQIYLLSSGEMSPFVLTMGTEEEPEFFYRVEGYFDGRILVDGPYHGNLRADIDRDFDSE